MARRTPPPTLAEVLRARGKLGPYTTRVAEPDPVEAVDPVAVRAWAAEYGVEVASRGPIPASVLEAYRNRET